MDDMKPDELLQRRATVRKFLLDRVQVHGCAIFPSDFFTHMKNYEERPLSNLVDKRCKQLAMSFVSYLEGLPGEKISIHRKFPAGAWDAFKNRWFPAWALSRWPVKWERVDVEKLLFKTVCPHHHSTDRIVHLKYLVEFDKED